MLLWLSAGLASKFQIKEKTQEKEGTKRQKESEIDQNKKCATGLCLLWESSFQPQVLFRFRLEAFMFSIMQCAYYTESKELLWVCMIQPTPTTNEQTSTIDLAYL